MSEAENLPIGALGYFLKKNKIVYLRKSSVVYRQQFIVLFNQKFHKAFWYVDNRGSCYGLGYL